MSGKERPVLVVSGFIKKNKKYLVVYDTNFNDEGFWRVPGGRVEYKESVENALIREIKEELNLNIKIKRFLGFGQDIVLVKSRCNPRPRLILYFECDIMSGKPEMRDKVMKELKWVTLEEMKKLKPLEPAMHDFFKRFKTI